MTNYEQLVKALRCIELRLSCNECEYGKWSESGEGWSCEFERRDADAADAIEALEKQIDSIENDKTNLEADIVNLEIALDKVNAQLPKRGVWVYNDGDYIPYCSICGMPQDIETPYCHSCGAKMMEAPKEE